MLNGVAHRPISCDWRHGRSFTVMSSTPSPLRTRMITPAFINGVSSPDVASSANQI